MSAMHKPDAPTPKLDQIMTAIVGLGASPDELREMIAAAIADARREGAEQMRAEAAKIARALPLYYGSGDDGADESLAQAIEDLPPPTGPRQAVRLTDAEIAEAFLSRCPAQMRGDHDARDMQARPDVMELGRVIETAVFAANNLGDGMLCAAAVGERMRKGGA